MFCLLKIDRSEDKIKPIDYINKNLPNLNWNILPQIFEENGVELTEKIRAYLKETPGNTNWNVFGSLENNSKSDRDDITFPLTVKIDVSRKDEEGDYDYEPGTYNYYGRKSIDKKWNLDVTSVKILVVDANGISIEGSPFTYKTDQIVSVDDQVYIGVFDEGSLSPIYIGIDKTYEATKLNSYEPGEWTFTITEV